MNYAIALALVLLLGILTLVSYVERLYAEIGKFLSREFQDNIDSFEQTVEPRLGVSRARASLAMAILAQLTIAAIALLAAFSIFRDVNWSGHEILEASLTIVLAILLCNRFLPFVFFSRTKGDWLTYWVLVLRALIYLVFPLTLVLGFLQSVTSLTKEHIDQQPETQAEAVDALIDAGQEEGILDEGNRDLIVSVVEFSGKTVREAMKPRPDITAVPVDMSVEKFIEMLKTKPFSRVPVYGEDLDHILGVVYAQDVLQVPDSEAQTRTVGTLMRKDVYFVPESKLSSDLLREMQKNNIRIAIVIDEYGGVAGLVTIEDLVEEIVGEIRDEHEKAEVLREGDHVYVVSGGMDVDRLNELFGVRPDGESTTVAGLVSELAGHIPRKGEVLQENGLRFEVLDSSERKVERVRIAAIEPQQMKLI
jgi:CBS domain containing-hemolysin-like protein